MTASSDVLLARLMSLHPKMIDLTLDRMWRLLEALDNPHEKLPPVVHIAGTNGKGSTLATIRAGLESTGARVHAYTSPHLARFHERIRLSGSLIAEDHLADALDRCEAANGGEPITYFEITTCAAFLAMAETPAEWCLLEVGLGGRLDATNVIAKPRLTVITPVDLDHQQYLGETVALIAAEKAGILKPGVACIVAPQSDEAMEVIEASAARLGAPLAAHGQHWHVGTEHGRLVFQDETGLLDLPLPVLNGPHQVVNAGTALAALRHLGADEAACEAAVTRAEWPARLQRLTSGRVAGWAEGCDLWLDGGHNPAAGRALAEALARMPPRPTHLVCGMLRTKDARGYLEPLTAAAQSLTALAIPGETATLSAAETADAGRRAGFADIAEAPDLQTALTDLAARNPGARLLICGSLYLAGHVLRENLAVED